MAVRSVSAWFKCLIQPFVFSLDLLCSDFIGSIPVKQSKKTPTMCVCLKSEMLEGSFPHQDTEHFSL